MSEVIIDTNTASLAEIEAAIEKLTAALESKKESAKREAAEKILEIARAAGLTVNVEGLKQASSGKGSRGPVAAKYRDANGNEWTGRGRKPRWVEDYLAAGGQLEAIEIK
ncbi:H-NS family nucleoid-associated regulatory protein [Crenobacter caeni]|uniref:H-NS histone family protein n=1 Tax=Crenobacter caeni TaxID=2705474 RepID=A0A6B2KV04_9NEIS|nr:H-NS histone family protein [Crenobacter caeni]NDV14076.1 H-NS histone family protein [Crenobacter caeni]